MAFFLCMYSAIEADYSIEMVNSSKDVAVGDVGSMGFLILNLGLCNHMVNMEAVLGSATTSSRVCLAAKHKIDFGGDFLAEEL